MGRRLELHAMLKTVPGVAEVYFQPPASGLKYPCILYTRDRASEYYANNLKYLRYKGYQITVMDFDPDSSIPDAVSDLPKCSFVRHFVADRLNHDIFTIFY